MGTENAAIARRYFSETEEPDKWKCKCGKQLIERKDCGWKNLSKKEVELNEYEKQNVTPLLIKDGCPAPEFVDSDESCFVVKCLKKRRMERAAELKKAKYTDSRYILSTSDLLKRFFSSADFAYGEDRQSLLPVNLEVQLFLKCNQSLCNEETVSKIVSEPTQIV